MILDVREERKFGAPIIITRPFHYGTYIKPYARPFKLAERNKSIKPTPSYETTTILCWAEPAFFPFYEIPYFITS